MRDAKIPQERHTMRVEHLIISIIITWPRCVHLCSRVECSASRKKNINTSKYAPSSLSTVDHIDNKQAFGEGWDKRTLCVPTTLLLPRSMLLLLYVERKRHAYNTATHTSTPSSSLYTQKYLHRSDRGTLSFFTESTIASSFPPMIDQHVLFAIEANAFQEVDSMPTGNVHRPPGRAICSV